MDDKIGVFICTGYGIAESLDVDALCKVVTEEMSVPFCKTVESCEGPGLTAINQDIEQEGLNKVVVAGISPRRYRDDAFPGDVMVEHIGLREQVVWCLPPGEEDTQMMAEDYLRMYITRLKKRKPLEPFQPEEEIDKSLLVVGGGIAGMTAALEAAHTGYDVRLVEKTDQLGGWLAKQHKSIPPLPPSLRPSTSVSRAGRHRCRRVGRGDRPARTHHRVQVGSYQRDHGCARPVRRDTHLDRQR